MGINGSKCPLVAPRRSADVSADPFLATCSRIEFYEAELLVRAYNTAWYGRQSSSSKRHGPPDGSPPTTPLYDSDDEPTEPSGVVNALAVNSPPASQQYRESHSRAPLPMLRSLSDPPALTTTATSSTDSTSLQFYPAAVQQHLPRNNSSNSHSKQRRSHISNQHEHSAPQNMRSAADMVSSHIMHLAGRNGTLVLPLSSAIMAAAAAGADSATLQQLSLVSNQGSDADPHFRPYHHIHMMQQRRAQHRQRHQHQPQHANVACAQTHSRGWAHVESAGMAEVTV